MTSPRRPGRRIGVRAWLLAVLAVVGLLAFGTGTASAHTLPDAGNRVRVSAPETITAVGVSEHITAVQGRGPPVLAAGAAGATGVAANSGVVSDTTARLASHVRKAVADYDSGAIGMSPEQAANALTPAAEARFRGAVIDQAVKEAVAKDPNLQHLVSAENGFYGPDFFQPGALQWWDITTRGQWQAHLDKYTSGFGSGIGLFTN